MGKKERDRKIRIEMTGSEKAVEDFLAHTETEYEIIQDGDKTIFELTGKWEKLNSVSLYIYSQFDYNHFAAIDEHGHAFLCW